MNRPFPNPLGISIVVLISALVLGVACYPRFDQQEQFGPNAHVALLIFFDKETTGQQVQKFWEDNLQIADGRGGYPMPDGVCEIGLSVFVENHRSISVNFCQGSTETQREILKARLRESPSVFKIFEDVTPAEINTLE